jgi:hypothetical protein
MIPTLGRSAIRAAGSVALVLIALGGIGWRLATWHQNPKVQYPPLINNAPSVNTLNQSGSTNTLAFDRKIADQLVGKLPGGKPIDVVAVGSPADWEVVGQYVSEDERIRSYVDEGRDGFSEARTEDQGW